jgi:hypothetical protein
MIYAEFDRALLAHRIFSKVNRGVRSATQEKPVGNCETKYGGDLHRAGNEHPATVGFQRDREGERGKLEKAPVRDRKPADHFVGQTPFRARLLSKIVRERAMTFQCDFAHCGDIKIISRILERLPGEVCEGL